MGTGKEKGERSLSKCEGGAWVRKGEGCGCSRTILEEKHAEEEEEEDEEKKRKDTAQTRGCAGYIYASATKRTFPS